MKRTLLLVILDGWGLGQPDASNPVHFVQPATFRSLKENFPMTSLQASGIAVGLPWNEVGNSEVGHLTIGAGKVIYQYFPRIEMAIKDGTFFENKVLKDAFEHARKNGTAVNLMGLLTEGTTHAALSHLLALIQMGERENVPVKLHLFADGKDASPFRLQKVLEKLPKDKLATVMGRYYGMDREKNWQLTRKAYDTLVGDDGMIIDDPAPIIEETYKKGNNEEFVPPMRFGPDKFIKDNEPLVIFNFREDSIRQIAESFILKDFKNFPRKDFKNLMVATMTHYEDTLDAPVIFPPEEIKEPLGKVLSDAGKTQLRIAESYKYAHVTYFFNAYMEQPFKNEYRVFIPSVKAAHVEEYPEMMASEITNRLIQALENQAFDFILANYSNPDTMGHTGNYDAAVEAVKTIDREIGRIVQAGLDTDSIVIITSDHGNIEEISNPFTGEPETQHDLSPVPFYLVAKEFKGRKFKDWEIAERMASGSLSDVAPTVLELMQIPKPPEMTGRSLLGNII